MKQSEYYWKVIEDLESQRDSIIAVIRCLEAVAERLNEQEMRQAIKPVIDETTQAAGIPGGSEAVDAAQGEKRG